MFDREEILRALEMFHKGETTEIRWKYRKDDGKEPSWGKRFQDAKRAAIFAAKLAQKPNTIAVWHQLNRINPEAEIEKLVKDEHIDRRIHILMDFDAIRPSGTNSTDEELQAAINVAMKAAWFLHDKGFPGFVLVMSGNGAQLIAAIDEAPEGTLVERFLEALSKQFTDEKVKVDTAVANAGRVVKLPGTPARKGPHSDERPHRMSRILRVFGDLTPVPTNLLESLAVPETELLAKRVQHTDPFDGLPILDRFDLPTWLTANDVPHTHKTKEDGTDVYEVPCPWKSDARTTGGAALYQDPEGSIQFYCHHDSCKGRTWKDYRRKVDPHYRERGRLPTKKNVKDAEYHARKLLETLPPCYLHRNEIWLYDAGIWQRPDIDDLRNFACRSLMRVFGQYANWVRERKSKAVIPSVTESFITNVLRCLKSILPQIPKEWEMPVWIDGTSAKVLVVENGILDLKTNKLRSHTPKLFAWSKLPYSYNAEAPCPKFLATLETIFDDLEEIDLLQEIYGTTIIGGNDRRAIWLFQGATHGGKGVLVGVLCALLGKHNYASIRAGNFGGQFALWAARNKLLIVVPDINGKKSPPAAFVEAAKVISGGDTIDIDGKNKQAVHEILPGKLLLVTNDLLRMEDESAALFNRFRCLKFVHSFFPEGHKLHESGRPQNERLEDELKAELPGILNWALVGLRRADKQGFTTPKASMELQEVLEAEGSPIHTYASERLEKCPDFTVLVKDVYTDYHAWCMEQEIEEPFKPAHFGISLRAAIPTVKREREKTGKRPYFYTGIRLATSA